MVVGFAFVPTQRLPLQVRPASLHRCSFSNASDFRVDLHVVQLSKLGDQVNPAAIHSFAWLLYTLGSNTQ